MVYLENGHSNSRRGRVYRWIFYTSHLSDRLSKIFEETSIILSFDSNCVSSWYAFCIFGEVLIVAGSFQVEIEVVNRTSPVQRLLWTHRLELSVKATVIIVTTLASGLVVLCLLLLVACCLRRSKVMRRSRRGRRSTDVVCPSPRVVTSLHDAGHRGSIIALPTTPSN